MQIEQFHKNAQFEIPTIWYPTSGVGPYRRGGNAKKWIITQDLKTKKLNKYLEPVGSLDKLLYRLNIFHWAFWRLQVKKS